MRLVRIASVTLAIALAIAAPPASPPCLPSTTFENGHIVAVYGRPGALRCP